GGDLAKLLDTRGKLPPAEAIPILQQVCAGLEAAHEVEVIHRDLKPQNIMLSEEGEAVITDFGLARSVEGTQQTRTAAVMGTPAYMSPEQAKGTVLDGRSDLFAFGIIAYEMLSGVRPYEAETLWGTLTKRTQEDAAPLVKVEPGIGKPLNDIVAKCLERDLAKRYQNAGELLRDLKGLTEPVTPPARSRSPWILAAAGVLVAAAGLLFYRSGNPVSAPVPNKVLSLLVADFENSTGDPVFSGTLEQMFSIALEGAPFINAYDRVKARKTAGDLQKGATSLQEPLARLVAMRENIQDVIGGSIKPRNGGYVLSARAIDAATGKTLAEVKTDAATKEAVLAAVGTLAGKMRNSLNPRGPQPQRDPFTAGNIEAAHFYVLGQEMQSLGKRQEAIANYKHAIQLDPNLGRAYAGLAASHRNLGQKEEAIRNYKEAMSRLDRMTDVEKYRTRGGYYITVGDVDKAIEEYGRLAKEYPADNSALSNVALAYFLRHDMIKALETGRLATERFPNSVGFKNNLAIYAMSAGDFAQAIDIAQQALKLNPSYEKGYIVLALSNLAEGKPSEAVELYKKLSEISTRGTSWAALGLGDEAIYSGRNSEAIATLSDGAAGDLASGDQGAASTKLVAVAQAEMIRGESPKAIAALDRARLTSGEGDPALLFPAAMVYLNTGGEAKAKDAAARLAKRLEPEPLLYSKLILGEVELKRKNAGEAIRLFREAQSIADTWAGHLALGRAYLEAEQFAQAHSEFELCVKRRGEATALFLDDAPTYRFFPPVYYYLGRTQEGLKSPAAAGSYQSFLAIKQAAARDPMVADARRRLTALAH
ncbi:MAG: protein kinase, partial [Acidobacteriota bacterium]|nr:protein kinase [Acidobacteriota bacterium]